MTIKNGKVLGSDFIFRETDLSFENGIITETTSETEIFDASEMYVLPGFIDTHIHGAAGARFSDENSGHHINSGDNSFLRHRKPFKTAVNDQRCFENRDERHAY